QQRAMFVAKLAQPFEKALLRHAQADVHHDRLENDRRNLVGIFAEAPLDGFQIVEGRNLHVREARLGNTLSRRYWFRVLDVAEIVSWRMRLHAHERCVVQPVISAFKLDDLVAASSSTGQSYRMHRRFGAAVAETAHLDGKARADLFRQLPL